MHPRVLAKYPLTAEQLVQLSTPPGAVLSQATQVGPFV
jgi:hypothetical protein